MPVTFGTNIAALSAQRRVNTADNDLSKIFQRLSSGQRITRASDDAAGLAVSMGLEVQSRVSNQAVRNLNDGISMLNIMDGALANLSDLVQRQRELAEQAANGVYSNTQRASLNAEAQQLASEYSRIQASAKFNGRNLLSGNVGNFSLQAGFGLNAVMNIESYSKYSSTSLVNTGTGAYTNYIRSYSLGDVGSGYQVVSRQFIVDDLNNDGIADIFATESWYNETSSKQVVSFGVFLGENGTTTFTLDASGNFELEDPGSESDDWGVTAEIKDINADGDLDITLSAFSYSSDNDEITEWHGYLRNNLIGLGSFSLTTLGSSQGPSMVTQSELATSANGDFNNDGVQDIVNNNNDVFIRIQNTTQSTVTTSISNFIAQSSFSLTSVSGARSALDSLMTLSDTLAEVRGVVGADLSRIDVAKNVLGATAENLQVSRNRIIDADIAQESAALTRLTILRDTASAVLAQANQIPALALSLLT